LSTRGTADGLWRLRDGQASEIWKNPDGPLTEPVAVSKDGSRIAVVVRKGKKRQLVVMSADGTQSRTLDVSIDIQGVAGQAAADWSPDGKWLVTSGTDSRGSALFKIPVDGGAPVRLVAEEHATNPVWSPRGDLIVYAGAFVGGQSPLLAMRPDGTPVPLPALNVNQGA
jgi:Tol biopolymer transport system component